MKVLFAGPSLSHSALSVFVPDCASVDRCGPAKQGDLIRAVCEGATAIGLVDGLFETVAAVWHKEILFALVEGVRVFGAASMGALRAAECAAFGMIGVGSVYTRYASGELDDDAAVAQLHAPAEFGYAPLTEALVNVEATLASLKSRGLLTDAEAAELWLRASSTHFKDRTYAGLVADMEFASGPRRREIALAIEGGRIDQKRRDAEQLVRCLAAAHDQRGPPANFHLSRTHMFVQVLKEATGGY
jgi:hypothetical protein